MGLNFKKRTQFEIDQESIGSAFMDFISWYNNLHKRDNQPYASSTYGNGNLNSSPHVILQIEGFGSSNNMRVEFVSYYSESDIQDVIAYYVMQMMDNRMMRIMYEGEIKIENYSSPAQLGGKIIEVYLELEKKFNPINEGLNLKKQLLIPYDKALEQFYLFVDSLGTQYEASVNDFGDSIVMTIPNIGHGSFIDATLNWKMGSNLVHISVEEYVLDPDTEEESFKIIYEDDIIISNPETMSDELMNYYVHLVNNTNVIMEGLNLPKKERLYQVELSNPLSEKKEYACIGYGVGWIDGGRLRHGVITELYRMSSDDMVVIETGDRGNVIEMPVKRLCCGCFI